MSENYFDKPCENKCLRCNQVVGDPYHPEKDISINYIRLLNIKISLNKLIYDKENNNEYCVDINPIWSKKLSKIIEKKGIKKKYKLDYGKFWWIYYYFYKSNHFQDHNQNNIPDSDSSLNTDSSSIIVESEFIDDSLEDIIFSN